MSEYSIRRLDEVDWSIFKDIRLKALATDPFVFGSTLAAESERTEEQWREFLRSRKYGVFVVFANDVPIGMTGIVVDRNDPNQRTALLWGSWLDPEIRGKGLSRMLYESRIEWARAHPTVRRVVVSHRASNLSSKFANQAFGFVPTQVTEKVWNDGIQEEEFHYELVV
ncbi:MAG: GNAT family N-acetyltransferase [Pyrinomonadaceae bacterium]